MALVADQPGPLAEAGTFSRHVAGAEANVAVGLARLGRRVVYVGRVGSDGFGTAIRRRLQGEGVDVTWLLTDPSGPTGVMLREQRAIGPAQVAYYRSGSAGSRLEAADVDAAIGGGAFTGARWLHLTGITPALSAGAAAAASRALEHARDAGLRISLDLNLRRRLWPDAVAAPVLRALAARVDVVLGSADECAAVTGVSGDPGGLAEALLALGPTVAVLKLGAEGALGLERGGPPVRRPAVPVPLVVDPVGAGDAFCAGFIAAVLDGARLPLALETANACGALAVASRGDMTGLPTQDELARVLDAGEQPDDTVR